MPRIQIAESVPVGSRNPANTPLVPTPSDATENHFWQFKRGDMILAINTNVGAQTVTLVSSASAQGRTGDEVVNLGAAGTATAAAVIGPLEEDGWLQANGEGHLDVSVDTDILLYLVRA